MLDFQLFRVGVHPSEQRALFQRDRSPAEVLKDAVCSLPSAELRRGSIWHVGNVKSIDEAGLYFRVGRTSKATVEVYQDGNFIDEEFEAAPYTHVILETRLEICAIARKAKLSPRTTGIASQFMRLLNSVRLPGGTIGTFEISEIKDPEDFIVHLHKAEFISKFWTTFSKPNPFDADEDFFKPVQRFLVESNGDKGKAEIEGTRLRPERLVELARSAAATGNDAGATLYYPETEQKVRKRLKGNIVELSQEDLADDEQRKGFLQRIREIYSRIRGITREE